MIKSHKENIKYFIALFILFVSCVSCLVCLYNLHIMSSNGINLWPNTVTTIMLISLAIAGMVATQLDRLMKKAENEQKENKRKEKKKKWEHLNGV